MDTEKRAAITVEATINAPVEKVWKCWTEPEHIKKWNAASDDWHTPFAENDLRTGGKFLSRMEARDGSFGFDFYGVYEDVKEHERISYTLGDERRVDLIFINRGSSTHIVERFDAESTNSLELQQTGWQAILNNFKKYAEQTAV